MPALGIDLEVSTFEFQHINGKEGGFASEKEGVQLKHQLGLSFAPTLASVIIPTPLTIKDDRVGGDFSNNTLFRQWSSLDH